MAQRRPDVGRGSGVVPVECTDRTLPMWWDAVAVAALRAACGLGGERWPARDRHQRFDMFVADWAQANGFGVGWPGRCYRRADVWALGVDHRGASRFRFADGVAAGTIGDAGWHG